MHMQDILDKSYTRNVQTTVLNKESLIFDVFNAS